MENQYEIAVLFDPGLEIDLEKATSKIEGIITAGGGKITDTDNWGKRRLAYPIKKQDFAIYVFYTAELPAQSVRKINDTLNITDEVMRFLITKPDLNKIAKAEALKADKAAKAAARGDKADARDDDDDSKEEE
jgi:small subunit ribosomal protein S6